MICLWHLRKCCQPCSPAYRVLQRLLSSQPPLNPVGTEPSRNGVRRAYWHKPNVALSQPSPGHTSTSQPRRGATQPKQQSSGRPTCTNNGALLSSPAALCT